MEFEGRPLPDDDALPAALAGDDRARCVRAAVVHAFFADRVITACLGMLSHPDPENRAVAIRVGHALAARALTTPLAQAILNDSKDLYDIPDPIGARATLAESALAFLAEVPTPGHAGARAALRHALRHRALAPLAWKVVGGEDPEAVLPHLAALLADHPELAPEAGTRFALLFTDHCEAAATAVAPLAEPTRRAFAAALEKHLLRIHAVKRWVACRRILFGQ